MHYHYKMMDMALFKSASFVMQKKLVQLLQLETFSEEN